MAVVLRKGNHCELVPPPWLNKSKLVSSVIELIFIFRLFGKCFIDGISKRRRISSITWTLFGDFFAFIRMVKKWQFILWINSLYLYLQCPPLHFQYELKNLFSFWSGAADIPDCENVRKLVQCLREVRHQKTLDGLKLIDGDPLKVKGILCDRMTLISVLFIL